MKYACKLLFVLSTFLILSCASRAFPRVPEYPAPGTVRPGEIRDPLERALYFIKVNSPLVEKFFHFDEENGIVVRGEYKDKDADVFVVYDLAAAAKAGRDRKGFFRVPFTAEDSASGGLRKDELFWNPRAADPAGRASAEGGVFGEAGLLLSFDDDYRESWRRHFDLFDRFGARVTFFIQGEFAADEAPAVPADVPAGADAGAEAGGEEGLAAFCAEVLRRGHDVGYHSAHHQDLTRVSRAAFDSETTEAAEKFRGAGISFSSFAFPFGFSLPWMREALRPVFKITRGYGVKFRLYDTEFTGDGYIISKAIDNIVYEDDREFEREIGLMLLAAKFIGGGKIVPFTSHDISNKADWGIKPKRLEYTLRTARDLGLRFYVFRDFSGGL
ncbi:MAG: polysaccharide deacetylase family protein [Treponema sp.]|jgi:peptidoglycan/xylan/chitin deacetylase (PgdA/CDA1 family)|nr:polysaccharide deacetylase family protein [Treponema sp.]